MLISNRCIGDLMPNLIKKSWTVSTKAEMLLLFCQIIWLFESWRRYGCLGSLKLEWLSQKLNVCLKSSTSHISNTPISFLATSVYSSYFKVQILCEGEENWKKFVFFLNYLVSSNQSGRFFQICMTISECLNFTRN